MSLYTSINCLCDTRVIDNGYYKINVPIDYRVVIDGDCYCYDIIYKKDNIEYKIMDVIDFIKKHEKLWNDFLCNKHFSTKQEEKNKSLIIEEIDLTI